MKAVVFKGIGDISLDTVSDPALQQDNDAIVRLTSSAICAQLVENVRNGSFDPLSVLTNREPMMNVLDAYKAFDARQPGWLKVKLAVDS